MKLFAEIRVRQLDLRARVAVVEVHGRGSVANWSHQLQSGDHTQIAGQLDGVHSQVENVADALKDGPDSIVSVFAGRIADTGLEPVPVMEEALTLLNIAPQAELLWASPREVLNIYQADDIGCHIITATNDLIRKLALGGKDLAEYSLETVQMFYDDAHSAGYTL